MKDIEKIELALKMNDYDNAMKEVENNKKKFAKKMEKATPEESVTFLEQMIKEQNKKRGEKDDKKH